MSIDIFSTRESWFHCKLPLSHTISHFLSVCLPLLHPALFWEFVLVLVDISSMCRLRNLNCCGVCHQEQICETTATKTDLCLTRYPCVIRYYYHDHHHHKHHHHQQHDHHGHQHYGHDRHHNHDHHKYDHHDRHHHDRHHHDRHHQHQQHHLFPASSLVQQHMYRLNLQLIPTVFQSRIEHLHLSIESETAMNASQELSTKSVCHA